MLRLSQRGLEITSRRCFSVLSILYRSKNVTLTR
jgi:hypothetical protein